MILALWSESPQMMTPILIMWVYKISVFLTNCSKSWHTNTEYWCIHYPATSQSVECCTLSGSCFSYFAHHPTKSLDVTDLGSPVTTAATLQASCGNMAFVLRWLNKAAIHVFHESNARVAKGFVTRLHLCRLLVWYEPVRYCLCNLVWNGFHFSLMLSQWNWETVESKIIYSRVEFLNEPRTKWVENW